MLPVLSLLCVCPSLVYPVLVCPLLPCFPFMTGLVPLRCTVQAVRAVSNGTDSTATRPATGQDRPPWPARNSPGCPRTRPAPLRAPSYPRQARTRPAPSWPPGFRPPAEEEGAGAGTVSVRVWGRALSINSRHLDKIINHFYNT